MSRSIMLVCFALALVPPLRADVQLIAPGTAQQDAVVVDTGPNGICETTAALGDIQLTPVGQATPFRTEIRCGANKVAETAAAGDDTQLIAVGAACKNANNPVVDTGPNGVADTVAAGDDTTLIAFGAVPSNTPCVITGGNGVADTAAASGDDHLLLAPVGSAAPNSDVIGCGPNLVVDTTPNNVNPGGDDAYVSGFSLGAPCAQNDVVIESGANGIAETRAEGPDLVLKVARPLRLSIGRGQPSASKTVKVVVSNVEFGASAPASRTYRLSATKGSCPGGTVNQVDADTNTPGLQATASVPQGGNVKGSFVVKIGLADVTSAASNIPFRCTVNVDAIAADTDPDVDDAANPSNNSTTVAVEVVDKNDL